MGNSRVQPAGSALGWDLQIRLNFGSTCIDARFPQLHCEASRAASPFLTRVPAARLCKGPRTASRSSTSFVSDPGTGAAFSSRREDLVSQDAFHPPNRDPLSSPNIFLSHKNPETPVGCWTTWKLRPPPPGLNQAAKVGFLHSFPTQQINPLVSPCFFFPVRP